MVFNGANANNNKLFCSTGETSSPIYDITTGNTSPVLSYTPPVPPYVTGEWYYANFVTAGGAYLCIVAAGAGYFYWSENTNTWTKVPLGSQAGKVSFPDNSVLEDMAYIYAYKSRIWFIKRNSATAYYLPLGSITGATQLFDFGPLLRRGGNLSFLTSWTYDAGDGMDDALVAGSYQGDMVVYTGTDPSSVATWSLQGLWYVGRMPYGRRNFARFGGDVVVLSEYGMFKVSEMVAGKMHTVEDTNSIAYKVNPKLAPAVTQYLNVPYWFMLVYATEDLLIIGAPYLNENIGIRQSFIMNALTSGWATITVMEPYCADVFNGQLIYGGRDGNVYAGFYATNDATSSDELTLGDQVTGRFQTAFMDFQDGTKNKRMLRVKSYGQVDGIPSFYVTFKPEYELLELINTGAPVSGPTSSWDQALWDNVTWVQGLGSLHKWFGVAAFGKKLSMQMAIRGTGRVLLTDFEALFEMGIGL